MTIDAIDFGRLYRDHLAGSARATKTARAWDARAHEHGHDASSADHGTAPSRYAQDFLARMNLDGASTLLDVGCGGGTIGLLLAGRLERIYGLDFSRAMLDALRANAAARGLDNVEPLHLAWEDDWSAVPECDIVVASRSTQVADMAAALAKLHAKARLRVYLTYRAGARAIDPEVLALLGRRLLAPPDYIYIINILHGMGIQPRLDYIEGSGRAGTAADFEDFARDIAWSLGGLSEDELARLRDWHARPRPAAALTPAPMRWAFISWEKQRATLEWRR